MNSTKRQILGFLLWFFVAFFIIAPQEEGCFSILETQRLVAGDLLNASDPVEMPAVNLIPGGHSIGVVLRTEGVLVVGFSPVINEEGSPLFPARDAGIQIGDVVTEINGNTVLTDDQAKSMIADLGKKGSRMELTVRRNEESHHKVVYPQYCNDTKSYRIGLFIRDNAGGVGTLTFYDPSTEKYGALGHVITDSETNQPLRIRQGKILHALVQDILRAQKGKPGEKIGMFVDDEEWGDIEKNDDCGIYGKIEEDFVNPLYPEPVAVAYSDEVHIGNAKILTVLKGQEIKEYNVKIERMLYGRQDGKNMIIRITDPELLRQTGGIVQGMSGSPIIQDGKLIGAVTHVFINEPDRGYGVFIERMLIEAGIIKQEGETLGLKSQGFIFLVCLGRNAA